VTSEDETWGALLEAIRTQPERTRFASGVYTALLAGGHLRSVKPLQYRCEHRCGLLDVFWTADGELIVGFPRYKTSPATTEQTSTESGRQKNTEDGWRRWKRHAAFAESVSNPPLSCDHLHNVPMSDDAIRADLDARHAEVIVRRDGSRYAVR